MEIIKRQIEYDNVSEESGILDISVSSTAPVPTVIGTEVLMHNPENIIVDRIKNTGTVLFNHDADEIVGKVEDVYISNGKLRAIVKISDNSEYAGFVKDGTLRNISVGYIVHETNYNQEEKIWYTSKWEPIEISFVAIPADTSVGVGRSLPVEEPIKITKIENIKIEESKMENYEELGKRFGLADNEIGWAKSNNLTTEQFQSYILEKVGTRAAQTKAPELELNKKEMEQYSLSRAILSQVKGSGVDNCLELEISREMQKNNPFANDGILIPSAVLMRDMSATGTSPNKGKDFIGTVTSNNFVDWAFAKSVCGNILNVQMLSGLSSNVTIPKISSAASFGWYSENGTISQVDPQTTGVTLSPKRGGASFNISSQLMKQANMSIDAFLVNHIQTAVSTGLDYAILNGTGSNQPLGIIPQISTNIVSGSSLTYAKLLEFPSKVAVANRSANSMFFVGNPVTEALLKSRPKESGQPVYLVGEDNRAAGYTFVSTNQVGNSTLLFGDFSLAVAATFGTGLNLVINPYTNARSGLVEIVASIFADCTVLDERGFTKSTNIS